MPKFIHIRSQKFPLLEEERDGEFFGKALAGYVQAKLTGRGYEAGFPILEDWGWWVGLNGPPFTFGVCIYGLQIGRNRIDFAVTDSTHGPRQWSWRRLRFVDTLPYAQKLHEDLMGIFKADKEVEIVEVTDNFPS